MLSKWYIKFLPGGSTAVYKTYKKTDVFFQGGVPKGDDKDDDKEDDKDDKEDDKDDKYDDDNGIGAFLD